MEGDPWRGLGREKVKEGGGWTGRRTIAEFQSRRNNFEEASSRRNPVALSSSRSNAKVQFSPTSPIDKVLSSSQNIAHIFQSSTQENIFYESDSNVQSLSVWDSRYWPSRQPIGNEEGKRGIIQVKQKDSYQIGVKTPTIRVFIMGICSLREVLKKNG